MTHGVKEPPTHAYLGAYLWAQKEFKAVKCARKTRKRFTINAKNSDSCFFLPGLNTQIR
ncbi:hypothetical protein [Chryseobacterium indoltheticum]|uniref:hypothetical protein n=1 Tax=Chryseobacterium indoltheticum TaxID=254 RepID=UPI003F4928B5